MLMVSCSIHCGLCFIAGSELNTDMQFDGNIIPWWSHLSFIRHSRLLPVDVEQE